MFSESPAESQLAPAGPDRFRVLDCPPDGRGVGPGRLLRTLDDLTMAELARSLDRRIVVGQVMSDLQGALAPN